MIAMLILAIVCISWLEIIGIQSARRESRRREAVECLSGMMDAFMYCNRYNAARVGCYRMVLSLSQEKVEFPSCGGTDVIPMFDGDISPVGYQLCVVNEGDLPGQNLFKEWPTGCKWLVGRLYDRSGKVDDVGRPFFSLPVYLGTK